VSIYGMTDVSPPPFSKMAVLYHYWLAMPGVKARADVDPLAIGSRTLGHVSVGHFLEGGSDLRYDLICEELKKVAPRLVPGALSSDALRIERTDFDMIHNLLGAVGRAGLIRVYSIRYRSLELVPRMIHTILLPLGVKEPGAPAEDLLFGIWQQPVRQRFSVDSFDDLTDDFFASLEASPLKTAQ